MKRIVCLVMFVLLCVRTVTIVFATEQAISIDTRHVYEGMEKSYAQGYLPTVSEDHATVVLPLLSEAVRGPLTVTVNLGEPASAPFVYKNYEKQFDKKRYTFDNEAVECYLIQFSFALSADRINGNYPITLRVSGKTESGEAFSQEFMLYVTISDGIDPHASEPEPTPVPVSQPKLMAESYKLNQKYVGVGESATLAVTIKNTSSSQTVKNIKLFFAEDSGEILSAGTGAQYCKQIGKGKSYTWSFEVSATTTAQSKPHTATITMEYEDSQGSAVTASDRITLPVRQPVRLEYEEPSLPQRVTQGDTPPFTMMLMNLGKGTIYNVLLKFDLPSLNSGGSVLVGTILPGESQTGRTNFRVESEALGAVKGTLLLSYEDDYGEYYEQEISLATTIEKKLEIEPPADTNATTLASDFPWWPVLSAGSALLALSYFFVSRWLKQKKAREDDEMRL
ncbi:MAG: hypothetical protein NUK65_07300 [Firmicutes bacterium]|nr:hypothetical protein [Bacillota bacterium]